MWSPKQSKATPPIEDRPTDVFALVFPVPSPPNCSCSRQILQLNHTSRRNDNATRATRLIDPKTPPLRCPNKFGVPLPLPGCDNPCGLSPSRRSEVGRPRFVINLGCTSGTDRQIVNFLSSPLATLPTPTSFLLLLHLVKVGDRLDRLAAPWPFVD